MKEIKNILILGLGAIGSIYAIKLINLDKNCVKVLLDKSRIDSYKQNGIIFNEKRYDFDYVLDTDTNYKADLIIIATKSTGFDKAADMIRNFVKEDTIIMSLLNGISSEKVLQEKYGKEKVILSFFLGHASMKKGNKITFDGVGDIFFGEENNLEYSPKVLAIKDLFDKAEITYKIPEDMLSAQWQKFTINIGANQSLGMLRLPYGLFETPYVRNVAQSLMEEAMSLAKHLGIKGYENFIENAFKSLVKMEAGTKPSMLQDVENKNETEVEIFAGEVCRLGKLYGIQTPKNELAYNIFKAIDSQI